MKVVIDTNVVVSAVLKDRMPETIIRFVTGNPRCEWIASVAIVTEYTEVLRRPKFGLSDSLLQEWETLFATFVTLVEVPITINFPRDRKDAKFLACALVVGADFFITGDSDFTEATPLVNTSIYSVTLFKQRVIDAAVP